MSVFVDTSAFYALLVSNDESHDAVRAAFASLVTGRRLLWTTSFVIVETIALLQHRIGRDAAKDFDEEVLPPAVRVRWVDDHLYRLGIDRLWREDRRQGAWSIASASSSCGWSVSARPSRWTCTSRTPASTCCREHAEAHANRRRRPRAADPSLLFAIAASRKFRAPRLPNAVRGRGGDPLPVRVEAHGSAINSHVRRH